jgi:MIP family channel proteins
MQELELSDPKRKLQKGNRTFRPSSLAKFPCSNCKKECLAELIGTYLLVLVGPASVVLAPMIPDITTNQSLLIIAITFGGIVGFLIVLFGEHSGAVFNPAITLGASVANSLRVKYFAPYLFFQICGGLIAGLTLKMMFGSLSSSAELGSTRLAFGISPILGISLEAAGTFVLTTSALLASAKIKSRRNQGLLVGLTLFFLILLIGPLTGAGFNPARSLGPSLASGYFQNLYVYFVGPLIGAIVAGLVFRGIRNGRSKRNLNIVCLC